MKEDRKIFLIPEKILHCADIFRDYLKGDGDLLLRVSQKKRPIHILLILSGF